MEDNKRINFHSLKYIIYIIHIFIIVNIINSFKSQYDPPGQGGGQGGYGEFQSGQQEIIKILIANKNNIVFKFSNLNILSFDARYLNKITETQLNVNFQDPQEARMISLSETISENNSFQKIYATVKNYLYIFNSDGSYVKNIQIQNMANYLPSIVVINEYDTDSNIISLFSINK